ncbi:MAG: hypothetical protein J1F32_00675 [Erysipelotrichales bacterium]|nr:hypothetical protein [Erysipelotrichales bacterium]
MFEQDIKFLKSLAKGINHFTGEKCDDDSILNDPNIIRALYEICDKLDCIEFKNVKKTSFTYPDDLLDTFEYEFELSLTKIIDKIVNMYPSMKKPKIKKITEALMDRIIVKKHIDEKGHTRTIATEQAQQYGIYNITRKSMYGIPYTVIVYNEMGQRYLLSLLKEIKF